jgi:hypothetical protein
MISVLEISLFPLALMFTLLYAYTIPMLLVMFIYFKLFLYVKEMSQRVTPINMLLRARKQLKMVRRSVILVMMAVLQFTE